MEVWYLVLALLAVVSYNSMEGMHSSYFWQLGASEESLRKQMRKLYDAHSRSVITREREKERESEREFQIFLPTSGLLQAAGLVRPGQRRFKL